MSVNAIREYQFPMKDAEENFHGNRVVYIGWDHHLMFCAPVAYPLPPAMPFQALIKEILPGAFGLHPDFSRIDWDKVEWKLDGEDFNPQMEASLDDNGVHHKAVIRMRTPGLNGINGTAG